MDPNETLQEIRTLVDEIETISNVHDLADAAERLAERVRALDEWLSKGGFLPDAWERMKQA